MTQRIIPVDLGDEGKMFVIAEQVGDVLVAGTDVVAHLPVIMSTVKRVSTETLAAVVEADPDKATVELGFGLAIETGQVFAVLGKAHGDAAIKVILEWSRDAIHPQPDGRPSVARQPAAATS